MTIKIKVEPTNGLNIPGIGHLKQGEHTVALTAADLKGAEGVKIIKDATPKKDAEAK